MRYPFFHFSLILIFSLIHSFLGLMFFLLLLKAAEMEKKKVIGEKAKWLVLGPEYIFCSFHEGLLLS